MILHHPVVGMPRTLITKENQMKMLSILTFLTLSLPALAISNSGLELRHQEAIRAAVKKQCHLRKVSLNEIKTEATPNRIDQGILDYDFISVLEAKNEFDQGQFDYYRVTVESHYSDAYDHDSRNWGLYHVSSVKCELI